MKQNQIVELTQDLVVLMPGETNIWPKGEQFIFRNQGPKIGESGKYPDRIISLTDGSMVAMFVVDKFEKENGKDILKQVTND